MHILVFFIIDLLNYLKYDYFKMYILYQKFTDINFNTKLLRIYFLTLFDFV